MSFETPPDSSREATSSTDLDQPIGGSNLMGDADTPQQPAGVELPTSPGSYWGTHWSQLPQEMVFNFVSDSQQKVRNEATAEDELLWLADQGGEGLTEDPPVKGQRTNIDSALPSSRLVRSRVVEALYHLGGAHVVRCSSYVHR